MRHSSHRKQLLAPGVLSLTVRRFGVPRSSVGDPTTKWKVRYERPRPPGFGFQLGTKYLLHRSA